MMTEIPTVIEAGEFLANLAKVGRVELVCEVAGSEPHQRAPFFISDPVDIKLATYGRPFLNPPVVKYATAPVNLYRVRSAVLLGSDGVVLHEVGPLRDTVHHISSWLPDCAIAEYVNQGSLRLKRPMPVRDHIAESVFIGFNAAWRNYAHWMQESLPKILAWRNLRVRLGNPKLVLPRISADSVEAHTLQILGIEPDDVIMVQPGEAVILDEAFMMSETSLFSVSSLVATAGQELARELKGRGPQETGCGQRVYIHRKVEWRRVANFATLTEVLERRGFAIVTFEDTPLARQIAIMREARYVIAEHGAGLINVMFCEPGARVLEMFNPVCVQAAFWSVSSACGHQYGFIVGSHVPSALRPDPDWNSAYEIAPERLDAAIATMLGERTETIPNPSATPVQAETAQYGGEETGDFSRATSAATFGRTGSDEYIRFFDSLTLPPQIPAHREAELPPNIRAAHYSYEMPPPVRIDSLANGIVWGNGLVTRNKHFFMPLGSYPPYMRPHALRADGHTLPSFWSGALDDPHVTRLASDDPIAVALHPNLGYGNLLLEMLPKFYQLAVLRTLGARFRLCLSNRIGAWIREFVAMYFSDDEIMWFDGEAECVTSPAVIVPPMMHVDHNYHPAMNLVIADALQRVGEAAETDRRRRLFVARTGDDRRLENDEAAQLALADLGFELIYPERMNAPERIRIFAQAEIIVGEYGPSLQNSVFSPPGTSIVAINWIDWYQSSIGRLRRHSVAYLPLSDGHFRDWRGDKQTGVMHRVDPSVLRQTVLEMLGGQASRVVMLPAPDMKLPAGDNRRLVLSFCTKYSLTQVEAFIASLRRSVPDADLCFFAANMAEDFLQYAAANGIVVLDAAPYLAPGLHPLNARFFMFRDLLDANRGRYEQVMISDARDVIFQADPFAMSSASAVTFAIEEITFANENLNARWISERYGANVLARIRRRPVACAGTTLGPMDGIRQYLAAMCAEIGQEGYDRSVNYDQASHNYIAWVLQPDWFMADLDDHIVSTVGCTSAERITIASGTILVGDYLPPVIHQWDRHPKLATLVAESAVYRLSPSLVE